MSNSEVNDDNLTTDAVPDPPRDEVKNDNTAKSSINEEFEGKTHDTGPNFTYPHKKYKQPRIKNNTSRVSPTVIHIENSKQIHIGQKVSIKISKSEKTKSPKDSPANVEMTEEISSLMKSVDAITQKHLTVVSQHVGQSWRSLIRILGFTDGQIDQFYEKNINIGVSEVVYQLLLDWKRNDPEEANIGKLVTALWDSNQYDAVKMLLKEVK